MTMAQPTQLHYLILAPSKGGHPLENMVKPHRGLCNWPENSSTSEPFSGFVFAPQWNENNNNNKNVS